MKVFAQWQNTCSTILVCTIVFLQRQDDRAIALDHGVREWNKTRIVARHTVVLTTLIPAPRPSGVPGLASSLSRSLDVYAYNNGVIIPWYGIMNMNQDDRILFCTSRLRFPLISLCFPSTTRLRDTCTSTGNQPYATSGSYECAHFTHSSSVDEYDIRVANNHTFWYLSWLFHAESGGVKGCSIDSYLHAN